jgi:hypothetical protein
MKLYKAFLHFMITLASASAFLAGWAALAHSLKPVQPVSRQPAAQLDPLPPVGQVDPGSSGGLLQLFTPSRRARTRTMLVTRGS